MGEAAGLSVPHLDEYQDLGIAHDEIDFSAAETDIAGDPAQPALLQVLARNQLRMLAYLSGCS